MTDGGWTEAEIKENVKEGIKWFVVAAKAWCSTRCSLDIPLFSAIRDEFEYDDLTTIMYNFLDGVEWGKEGEPGLPQDVVAGYRINKQIMIGGQETVPWQVNLRQAIAKFSALSHVVRMDGEDFILFPDQPDEFKSEMTQLVNLLNMKGCYDS